MQNRRVVVTGLGAITPLGNDVESFWNSLLSGISGVNRITRFDPEPFNSQIAGEVKGFDPIGILGFKKVKRTDLYTQYALVAAAQAIDDSGLVLEKTDGERAGAIVATGIGGISTLLEQHKVLLEKGPQRVSPFLIPMMIADIASGEIAIEYGFKGPNFTTTSACASSAHAISTSYRLIVDNYADIMITGGAEAPLIELSISGFCSARSLSLRNDDPTRASRPFDKDRDGFVIAEGSGILVLEELNHALFREARIYGEIIGCGFTADAYHLTAPSPDGDGAFRVMRNAIQDAQINPQDIDYVNTHGTSTVLGDIAESQAIARLFKNNPTPVKTSSTKSMTGHMLGAAAAVESIATLKTIETSIIHPTINFEHPDPECDIIDITPNQAVKQEVNTALVNSFGFGGHNSSFIFKKYL
ncbi:beta-ketoacyl-ACP synthase II [bacterium]|nr:beta-ketoacyl-ACP synthase II [bacterium]